MATVPRLNATAIHDNLSTSPKVSMIAGWISATWMLSARSIIHITTRHLQLYHQWQKVELSRELRRRQGTTGTECQQCGCSKSTIEQQPRNQNDEIEMQTFMPTTDFTGPEAASSSRSAFNAVARELSWLPFALSVPTGWNGSGMVIPVSSFSPEVSIGVLKGIEMRFVVRAGRRDIRNARGRGKSQWRNIIYIK